MLKKSVDCLGSILSQCAMDHKKLESMFRKKQVSHIHAHKPRHTHAHTHDTMYSHVYTCTHCGRMVHLAKFCYERLDALNFVSKHVWVRKGTTPMDLRKCGYQDPPLLYLM